MLYYRFRYFVKRVPAGYGAWQYEVVRLRETDPRIPEYVKKYSPLGWSTTLRFPYMPTAKEEVHQLHMRFGNWGSHMTVKDVDEKPVTATKERLA